MMEYYNSKFGINFDDAMNFDFLEKCVTDVRADLNTNSFDEVKLNDLLDVKTIDESMTGSTELLENNKVPGIKSKVSEMNQNSQTDMIEESSWFGLSELENSPSTLISAIKNELAHEEVSSSTWYTDLVAFTLAPEHETFNRLPDQFSSAFQSTLGQGTFSSHEATTFESVPENYIASNEMAEIAYEFIQEDGRTNAVVSSSVRCMDLASLIQEPRMKNDLKLPRTFDNSSELSYSCHHQPLYYQVLPDSSVRPVIQYCPDVRAPRVSGSSGSSASSYSSSPSSCSPSKLKRKLKTASKPNAKRLKTDEDANAIEAMAGQIPVYRTVPESESSICTGICNIMLPYAPYPFEPKLFLAHVSDDKFAYRFNTAEDRNTNMRCLIKQSSSHPEPPIFWCLQCGVEFGRSTTARRHSKNIHQNSKPVYKQSYFIIVD